MPRKTIRRLVGKHLDTLASMRPRPDAAENSAGFGRPASRRGRGFNEAAARCRGKPARSLRGGAAHSRLQ